ncbi:MAG: glycosyltransferase [Rickettsiales bacterium]|nr:glycosyltransferase [Rickettsiales bacterium]|tara:strand:+ start:11275 stop:11967 length:693 start_codon:yes stop_codon:yes gene_type:complete
MNKVFVGYDPREDIAYQVCKHSIARRNKDVLVRPLIQKELREAGWYTRPIDPLSSTEFTFTRFLIPELCDYKGWALFMDCDMILLTDIQELFDQADDKYAVMCVHHDYTPREGMKMDGQKQVLYPRKNWSSVMLFNCGHPSNKQINSSVVNNIEITGKYLHRFSWLKDSEVGQLSHEWNWLTDWYKEPEDGKPKLLHYTEGGPWFENYRDCDYHKEWKIELADMMNVSDR